MVLKTNTKTNKKQKITSIGEDLRKWKTYALLMGIQNGAAIMKAVWYFLKNLKVELPYDPMIPLLFIDSKQLKTGTEQTVHMLTFMAMLFTISKGERNQVPTDR
jgi:uncharacterized membrane protein